ncbi:hypothetical protein BGW42_007594 [Actinomortierella wolfii]|nr:hypothetical protein BGW42_007594 [Actinomortierella wolfii]
MEYTNGGSLHDAILEGRLEDHENNTHHQRGWAIKTLIAQGIVRGLDHLHLCDILCYDLKSSNVLLTTHMEAKLCDFGLAAVKVASASKSLLPDLSQNFQGSLRWMAPELLTAFPEYSKASDMYAFGMVLWEMAARCTVPFRKQLDDSVIIQLVKCGERERLPDNTPIEYRQQIEWCWEHDPRKRPQAYDLITTNDIELSITTTQAPTVHSRPPSVTVVEEPLVMTFTSTVTPIRSAKTPTPHASPIPNTQRRSISADSLRSTTSSAEIQTPKSRSDVPMIKRRAQQGDVEAQMTMAFLCLRGECGVVRSDADAFDWYLRAAENGHAGAQYNLALMYLEGQGVPQSDIDAFRWFHAAAVQGNATAQFSLAAMYDQGSQGIEQNDHEAAKWYRMAAEQGNIDAQLNLALMYHDGQGIEQSYVEAVKWLLCAAEQGDASAQFNLAVMFDQGHGVEQSDEEASQWYRMAAEQGHANAQYNIAVRYSNGRGVEKSDTEAARWYHMAAEQGHTSAQFNLAVMYSQGKGVEQNSIEAVKWYMSAAQQGDTGAQSVLQAMTNLETRS